MGQGEDDMVMITGQEPRLLEGEPALGLEVRTLRTGPMPTRVVPDTGDVAVGARLEMTAQGGRPALDDRTGGFPDMGGQRVQRLVGGKGVLEDRLERDQSPPCLRTQSIEPSSGCFVQYHANYPRDKRLVQPMVIATWEMSRIGGYRQVRMPPSPG